MNNRHDDNIPRPSATNRGRFDERNTGMRVPGGGRHGGNGLRRMIPLIIFTAIGLFIAYQEVPAFSQWWEKTFFTVDWEAKAACHAAIVQQSKAPDFLRILESGEIHDTENGRYVDNIVIGEMGQDGAEQKISYSCYLDAKGQVARLNRL